MIFVTPDGAGGCRGGGATNNIGRIFGKKIYVDDFMRMRNEMNVAPSKKVHYTVATAHAETFTAGVPFFLRLASACEVTVAGADAPAAEGMVEVVTHAARVLMPLAELVDFEKELARIAKEKANAEKQLAGIEGKLKNEAFVSKAPAAVVNAEREKAEKLKALIEKLDASAKAMQK